MHRIDTAGATPDHHFQNGDPGAGTPSTVVDASWLNSTQEEICGVIEAAGITLGASNAQLLAALQVFFAQLVPSGVIQAFGGPAVPSGWLACEGQSVARVTYPALFSAIGTTWGSVDADHFTLPDTRGEFLRGWDDSRGVDSGRAVGTFQDWATGAPKTTTATRWDNGGLEAATNPSTMGFARASKPGESTTTRDSDAVQSPVGELDLFNLCKGDSETRPRNVAVRYIIKT